MAWFTNAFNDIGHALGTFFTDTLPNAPQNIIHAIGGNVEYSTSVIGTSVNNLVAPVTQSATGVATNIVQSAGNALSSTLSNAFSSLSTPLTIGLIGAGIFLVFMLLKK